MTEGHGQHEHEHSDIHIRPAALFGAGLAAFLVVAMLFLAWLYGYFSQHQPPSSVDPSPLAATTPQQPPEPRLQVSPAAHWREKQQADEQALNSYGWVDRPAGVVRIPIDRAIDLVAQEAARP